jgi:hypothetical protein
VLTVLIGETADHKWQYDIVTDIPGVCFCSLVGHPLASREEAEKGALGGLALLGPPLQPADDYEPEDLDGWETIRVNGSVAGASEGRHCGLPKNGILSSASLFGEAAAGLMIQRKPLFKRSAALLFRNRRREGEQRQDVFPSAALARSSKTATLTTPACEIATAPRRDSQCVCTWKVELLA